MESQAKYALVGAVVILVTVLVVSTVVWLSSSASSRGVDFYTVYFKDQTLDGLQVDGNVTMKGIKVGSVESFDISPQNIEQVKVILKVDSSTPVKTDTKALIKRNLLTGLAFIDLVGSSQDTELLKDKPQGESYPIIPEGKSDFAAITDNLPALIRNTADIVDKANTFLSDENRKAVSDTIQNFAKFSEAFGQNDKKVAELIKSSAQVVDDMRTVTGALRKAFADDRLTTVTQDIAGVLENVDLASRRLAESINEIALSFRGASDVIVQQVSTVSKDISRAAQSFSATMERFEEPRSLIVGPSQDSLGPGERTRVK